jgi:hypothetical protein
MLCVSIVQHTADILFARAGTTAGVLAETSAYSCVSMVQHTDMFFVLIVLRESSSEC